MKNMNAHIIIKNMSDFGNYLGQLREIRNMTKTALAERMGVSQTYISHVESGRVSAPNIERLRQIVEILNLNEEEKTKLFTIATESRLSLDDKTMISESNMAKEGSTKKSYESKPGTRAIYILGSIPAGPIDPSADYVMGTLIVDSSLVGNREVFALKVKGNCLIDKGIFENDIVIIEKTNQIENGKIAVLRIFENGHSTTETMKIFYREGDKIILTGANSSESMAPIIITEGTRDIEIIGKVIKSIRDFR